MSLFAIISSDYKWVEVSYSKEMMISSKPFGRGMYRLPRFSIYRKSSFKQKDDQRKKLENKEDINFMLITAYNNKAVKFKE